MRFRKQTSYNSHDSKFVNDHGRLTISNGVEKRCELVINRLLKEPKGSTPAAIATNLNSRFKQAAYSETDVRYACLRLTSEGILRKYGRGKDAFFKATPNTLANWRNLEKETL